MEVLLSKADFTAAEPVLQELKRIATTSNDSSAISKVNASELVLFVCMENYEKVVEIANNQLQKYDLNDKNTSVEVTEILTTKGIA